MNPNLSGHQPPSRNDSFLDGSNFSSFVPSDGEDATCLPDSLIPSRHQEPTRNDPTIIPTELDMLSSDDRMSTPRMDISLFVPSDGEDVTYLPDSLIPSRHQEPTRNDPTIIPTELDMLSSDNCMSALRMDLSLFEPSDREDSGSLPDGLIPSKHREPTRNDFVAKPIDMAKLFSKDLELTDAKGGIRNQKTNRNLDEMASAIARRHTLAVVENQLCRYKAPCWRVLSHNEARQFVVEVVKELFNDDAKYLSPTQYNEIVARLCYDEAAEKLSEIPAPDYNYLCCRDSLYDWHSGKCIPHDSSDMRFSYLDIDAEEIGRSGGEHWDLFLDNLTGGDDDLRQRILEVIGVILSGYPSKSFFLLEGESGTGKSQLANFLRDVLGESSCFALNDVAQLSDRWTPGSLMGKLLCICGDVPQTPLPSNTIGTIKQLTGDDLIRGEMKYKDAFTFENTAKLLFASNFPLQISERDQDAALMNRLVVIPCHNPVPIKDQIPDLHRHLHQEAGYIIGLAMDALIQFEERNGIFTPLSPDYESEAVQMPYAERQITEFVQTYCLLREDATCTVAKLFQAFQDNVPGSTLNVSQFSKILYQHFPAIKSSRTKEARHFKGIALKSDSESSVLPDP